MDIGGVEAFNSATTPEVILKITGLHDDGCVSHTDSLGYHQLDGNTITVWATIYAGVIGCYCTEGVEVISIVMSIGALEAGEYKVVSRSGELLLTFHTDNNNCYLTESQDTEPGIAQDNF